MVGGNWPLFAHEGVGVRMCWCHRDEVWGVGGEYSPIGDRVRLAGAQNGVGGYWELATDWWGQRGEGGLVRYQMEVPVSVWELRPPGSY